MELIADGYENRLSAPETAALRLTDAIIGMPAPPSQADRSALAEHYTEAQIVEMALGVALFMSMSKLLITLGLEPEQMDITVAATPGS